MSCDDPDRFGWKQITTILDRDGICGFRLIPSKRVGELRVQLMERGYRFDAWDVFIADRSTALAAIDAILSQGLPHGFAELERPTDPESDYMSRIQMLMGNAGVVPFSGSLLAGHLGPATTVVVGDEDGSVVATAHGYLPHNVHSAYHRYAWGGLAAVAESHRGKGLGTYVNARMIASVFHDLEATHIYELVSAANTPSRLMIEACGLRSELAFACGFATRNDGARFTR